MLGCALVERLLGEGGHLIGSRSRPLGAGSSQLLPVERLWHRFLPRFDADFSLAVGSSPRLDRYLLSRRSSEPELSHEFHSRRP